MKNEERRIFEIRTFFNIFFVFVLLFIRQFCVILHPILHKRQNET